MIMKNDKKQLWQVIKFTLFSISAGVIQVLSFAIMEILVCSRVRKQK